ncbi:hypothetical protein ACJRO7_008436 [Eucalyptus globulus]|uniref:Profilin n=1 Tax=Eucalyptus globulus TaxID=34317 RepID=A0ABD3IRZ2_EUCGL
MEWEAYYEDYLMFKKMSTRNEEAATTYQAVAIIGQDGNVWAQTSDFPPSELPSCANLMNPGALTTMGLYLGAAMYVVTGVKPGDIIRAKKQTQGMTIKKTGAALVIGECRETDSQNIDPIPKRS